MQFVVDFRTHLSVHLGEGGQSRNLGDFIVVTVTAYVFLNPELYMHLRWFRSQKLEKLVMMAYYAK